MTIKEALEIADRKLPIYQLEVISALADEVRRLREEIEKNSTIQQTRYSLNLLNEIEILKTENKKLNEKISIAIETLNRYGIKIIWNCFLE